MVRDRPHSKYFFLLWIIAVIKGLDVDGSNPSLEKVQNMEGSSL